MIPARTATGTTTTFLEFEASPGPCEGCRAEGRRAFYLQQGVPTNSGVLADTPEEARAFPRGELRLAWCPSCGFLGNVSFDPALAEQSARYDETRAQPGTFKRFARALAQRLVTRHGVRGKSVLEIGCGTGEFLELLCELGQNTGTGIDPSFCPARCAGSDPDRPRFIRGLYDERYQDLTAEVVVCRHTLELLHDPLAFLTRLRQNLDRRCETLVFLEVSDVLRVLEEGAFWDLYYEHCSYFTAGSLARLLRCAGFDVLALDLDYDDQYIVLVAKPARGPTAPESPLESDLARIERAVRGFSRICAEGIACWMRKLNEVAEAGEHAVVWGVGSQGVTFLNTLQNPPPVQFAVDIDPSKQNKYMPLTAQRVIAPEALADEPQCVIVMNPIHEREVGVRLRGLSRSSRMVCAVNEGARSWEAERRSVEAPCEGTSTPSLLRAIKVLGPRG